LDGDYDGRTFCVTQAFFPDRSAWDKLGKALGGVIPEERFDGLSGTTSLPFRSGKHRRTAVKVIDPRGNEVMSVLPIPASEAGMVVKGTVTNGVVVLDGGQSSPTGHGSRSRC
jgi:adenine-specific DNA-methyltransferase